MACPGPRQAVEIAASPVISHVDEPVVVVDPQLETVAPVRTENEAEQFQQGALAGSARSSDRDALRAASDEAMHDGNALFAQAESAEARVALAELSDWLRELPPEQRVAITLTAIEGRTSAEAAEILGVSEGAIEQRLVRARSTLRERRNG